VSRLYQTTDYKLAIVRELQARGLYHRDLARALGRSDGWLSLALRGDRPLPPSLVDAVAAFLGLDAEETAYLGALVELASQSPRARRAAWVTVAAIQRQRAAADLTEDVAAAFASWYVAAIAELARCDGFRPDPQWIARTLHPPICAEQAEEALTRLIRLGLLLPDEVGGLRPGPETWSQSDLPEGPISEAAATLHRSAMQLGQDAIEAFRFNERHHSSMVLAIPEARFAAVQGLLRELERQLALEASDEPGAAPPNRVYLFGLQLFPVSLYTDAEPWVRSPPEAEDEDGET
jgi:uncharacterized protein (TIGR02147 family)